MLQQGTNYRPLIHKNPKAKELLISQLNKRFSIHQGEREGKTESSPIRTVSGSLDSANLKDLPPFNNLRTAINDT